MERTACKSMLRSFRSNIHCIFPHSSTTCRDDIAQYSPTSLCNFSDISPSSSISPSTAIFSSFAFHIRKHIQRRFHRIRTGIVTIDYYRFISLFNNVLTHSVRLVFFQCRNYFIFIKSAENSNTECFAEAFKTLCFPAHGISISVLTPLYTRVNLVIPFSSIIFFFALKSHLSPIPYK